MVSGTCQLATYVFYGKRNNGLLHVKKIRYKIIPSPQKRKGKKVLGFKLSWYSTIGPGLDQNYDWSLLCILVLYVHLLFCFCFFFPNHAGNSKKKDGDNKNVIKHMPISGVELSVYGLKCVETRKSRLRVWANPESGLGCVHFASIPLHHASLVWWTDHCCNFHSRHQIF